MLTKHLRLSITAATFAALCTSALAGDPSNASRDRPGEPPAGVAAARDYRGESGRHLIGQDIRGRSGESLGQIKDLVVDPKQGRIVYALVGSGGLLGVGETIRAVPFGAFHRARDGSDDFVIDLDRPTWDRAPAFSTEHADQLADRDAAREIFSFYQQNLEDHLARPREATRQRLVRVSEISGHKIVNAGQEVGEVEDVIVHFDTRRVSAVVDPDDEYTGTNQKFIVNFDQLTPEADQRLSTTLSRDDFSRAAPAEESWWLSRGGFPYIWGGYGSLVGPTAFETIAPNPAMQAEIRASSSDRRSIDSIRTHLQQDSRFARELRNITLRPDGHRLVVSGAVRSKEIKDDLIETITAAAGNWNVVDRLVIQSATE